jgi:hypothetical protein
MIDRIARDKFATLLRRLATGAITNFKFEDEMIDSQDIALSKIEYHLAWPSYDDFYEHRMTEDHVLTLGDRRNFARAILFLKSDLPYEWTDLRRPRGFRRLFMSIYMKLNRNYREPVLGDLRVWPFFRRSDYRQALRHPPFLKSK